MRMFEIAAVLALLTCACGHAAPGGPTLQRSIVVGPQGQAADVRELARGAPATVLVFFSNHCHCLEVHDPRIKALYDGYAARGTRFFMVDSEVGAAPERDRAEASRRGYPFPILIDRGGRLADQLGADYATFSVVVDAGGVIRYRGGIDSDKSHLRDDATPFLQDALDDVLAGRVPRVAQGKTLGCALQKW